MKKLTLVFATLGILVACSKNDADKLAAKKSELAKLQAEEKALLAKIKTLESELEVLNPKKEEEKVIAVAVSPIISQNFNHFVEIQGRVDAKNNVFVSPQTGGAITNLFVREGDFVKQRKFFMKNKNHCGNKKLVQKFNISKPKPMLML